MSSNLISRKIWVTENLKFPQGTVLQNVESSMGWEKCVWKIALFDEKLSSLDLKHCMDFTIATGLLREINFVTSYSLISVDFSKFHKLARK